MSVISCPRCGHKKQERMPQYASQMHYKCSKCMAVLTVKPENCCVYCTYGSRPCPPSQRKQIK